MRRLDRLYLKAAKLKKGYRDVVIITNETGVWKIEEMEFTSLQAAERHITETTGDREILIIVNDAGPGMIREVEKCVEDKIEDENTFGNTEDLDEGNEYGGIWRARF